MEKEEKDIDKKIQVLNVLVTHGALKPRKLAQLSKCFFMKVHKGTEWNRYFHSLAHYKLIEKDFNSWKITSKGMEYVTSHGGKTQGKEEKEKIHHETLPVETKNQHDETELETKWSTKDAWLQLGLDFRKQLSECKTTSELSDLWLRVIELDTWWGNGMLNPDFGDVVAEPSIKLTACFRFWKVFNYISTFIVSEQHMANAAENMERISKLLKGETSPLSMISPPPKL